DAIIRLLLTGSVQPDVVNIHRSCTSGACCACLSAEADCERVHVDLANVDRLAIGLGAKAGTTGAGGTGTMYIDDIRLYRSSQ
ncbi:MAG: hypothetical protein P8Z79_16925, partial [Sedimentisphaerales bacterium]